MLNRISSGWLWLENAMNALIDEINRQKPLASSSIAIEESPNGTLLKVTQPQQPGAGGGDVDPTPWKTTPDGETAGWQQIIIFNAKTHEVIRMWAWGGSGLNQSGWWQQVATIDPATCAPGTITVLGKAPT